MENGDQMVIELQLGKEGPQRRQDSRDGKGVTNSYNFCIKL